MVLRLVTLSVALAIVTAISGANLEAQDHYATRDAWQRVDDIFRAIGIRPGSSAADLGAGGGYFTTRMAKAVGPSGRVFAIDINPSAIDTLQRLVQTQSLANVTVVPSEPSDPKLAPASVDSVLIVNAYHEMLPHRAALLPRLYAALKPGGRLGIVDNRPDDRPGGVPGHASLSIEEAARQLAAVGFTIELRDAAFTKDTRYGERIEWFLVGRKQP